ncbi:hypothetical protein GIB67_037765, partial [Kingdonia uniflora]
MVKRFRLGLIGCSCCDGFDSNVLVLWGSVDARKLFDGMSIRYVVSWNAMVTWHVKGYALEANGAIWGLLLPAFRVYDDVELGEFALKHLVKLEPYSRANYTILSNIYSASGRWQDAGMFKSIYKVLSWISVPLEIFDSVPKERGVLLAYEK